MVSAKRAKRRARRNYLLLLLTAGAGAVDAYGLLAMGHVFASALTGNTVLLGIALAQRQIGAAIRSAFVFLGFIPGAIVSAWILRQRGHRYRWDRHVELVLGIEMVALTLVLAGVLLGWPGRLGQPVLLDLLVVALAFAMGLQNMVGRGVSPAGISTTYVTGPVIRLVNKLVSRRQPRAGAEEAVPDGPEEIEVEPSDEKAAGLSRPVLYAAVWTAYLGGVIVDVLLLFGLPIQGRMGIPAIPWLAAALPLVLVSSVACAAPLIGLYRSTRTGRSEPQAQAPAVE